MGDKSKDEIGIKLLQSLLQNDSFDVSKQYFYYADTKENYNNNIVKDTFLSFDQYNIFIKEASNLNGGVVRANISKDSKICYIDENKNINAEIEKAKSEGYDFAIVNNNNKYEYVILNKDKIFNKTFLSIDEAKKECSELEKQYNEMTKKITGVTSFSNENNKTVTYSQNDYSKKEQSKISDTLKEYGLIEESDSISNKDELIKGIDQIKRLNTEFNVDIGSLELAIERLQNVDVSSFYSSLVNVEKLLSSLDLKVSNNCLTEVLSYVQSNLQNSETGSDKAKSYLNKLNQLKKTLSSNNSNYEIEKYKSLLANIDNFADDLGLSSIEKRNMVQENSEALMTLIRPQIEKMEELSLGTTGRGKKILLHDNNNTLDYLESLYAYAKNSNIYYDNVALGEIVEKRIKGENLSLDEQSFLLNEHSNVAFEVLAQINYLTDDALTKEENEWYNQNISKFSDIDIKFLDIGMTQLSYQISSGERLSIDKQTFFDQNKEGWNERSKYKLEKAQTQYDSLVNNKNMTRINVTHSNIKENELDYGYYVYYITDDGKYVTEQEYKEEVARVNKINYSNSGYVSGKKIDLSDETVLEQPTIKEVKIASAFDMLSETDQYVVGGNIQYNRQYSIGLANDVNNCNALLSEINGRINNIKNAMNDVISIQSTQSDESYDLENHIYAVYGIAHIKSLEDLQTLLNTEVSEEKKLSEKRDNFNKEYLEEFNYYNNELLDIQKGIILKKSISTYTNDDFDFLNIEYPYQQLLMDNNEIELEQIEISGQREDISLDVTFENLKHFFINGIASIGDGFETLKAISDKTFFNEYYNENVLKGGYTYSKRWAESLEESNPTLSKERKLCERSLELTNRRNSNDQKMHMLTSRNLDFEEYANNYRIKAYEVENGMYYTFYSDEAKTQKIEVDTSEFAIFLKSQGVDELEGWVYIDKNGKYERVDKKVNNELYSMQQYDDYKLAADIINYDYNKHVIDLKDWTNEEFNNYLKEKMDIGNRLGGMKIAEQWACKTDKYGKPYVYGRSFVNGLNQWWNGMQNLFSADGVVNSNDYACMYYTQILSADYSTIDAMADEIITSIGNMAPSIAIQLAVTALAYFCPPSAGIALALMQNASTLSMGLSATGNAREQALQQGLNNSQAWLYGILTGSSEALLERVLGGIRGLSMDPNLEKRLLSKAIGEYFESGFGGFISDMFSEGLEESIQEILDPVFKGLATGNYDAIDWNAVFKSGIYGAITSGVMNVGHVGISNSIGAISYLTTGSSIGLTTLIGKYSGGKLIADFDLFKADFGAVTKARKNGTLSDTITKLSNSTDVQTQYDAYVKEYEELEKNTKNKENLGKMQTKNEFVEALAIEAITSSENIELNLKFIERDLNNKRLELESINKQIETETNEQAKTKLQKKAESLQGEVVSLLAQQSRFNQIKILGNDYFKIALLSANPIMSLLSELIKSEEFSEEAKEESTTQIAENGEIIRNGVGEVTESEINSSEINSDIELSELIHPATEADFVPTSQNIGEQNTQTIDAQKESIKSFNDVFFLAMRGHSEENIKRINDYFASLDENVLKAIIPTLDEFKIKMLKDAGVDPKYLVDAFDVDKIVEKFENMKDSEIDKMKYARELINKYDFEKTQKLISMSFASTDYILEALNQNQLEYLFIRYNRPDNHIIIPKIIKQLSTVNIIDLINKNQLDRTQILNILKTTIKNNDSIDIINALVANCDFESSIIIDLYEYIDNNLHSILQQKANNNLQILVDKLVEKNIFDEYTNIMLDMVFGSKKNIDNESKIIEAFINMNKINNNRLQWIYSWSIPSDILIKAIKQMDTIDLKLVEWLFSRHQKFNKIDDTIEYLLNNKIDNNSLLDLMKQDDYREIFSAYISKISDINILQNLLKTSIANGDIKFLSFLSDTQYEMLLKQSGNVHDMISYFDSLRTDNMSILGANQNINLIDGSYSFINRRNTVSSEKYIESYYRIVDFVKKKYNMPIEVLNKLIVQLDDLGACSYASMCNLIYIKFMNNPQAFKNIFGFDMYEMIDGQLKLNYRQLMLDMYIHANTYGIGSSSAMMFIKDEEGRLIYNDVIDPKTGEERLANASDQLYMTNYHVADNYFSNYGLKLKKIMIYTSDESINQSINLYVKQAIDEGYMVELLEVKANDIIHFECIDNNYDNTDTSIWNEEDGHATAVIGANETGLYIISWGRKYFIKYSDLKNKNYHLRIYDLEGIKR